MPQRIPPQSLSSWLRAAMAGLLIAHVAGCGMMPNTAASRPMTGAQAAGLLNRDAGAAYYKKVTALSGKALVAGLHTLIAPHKVLEYDPARDVMFKEVDDLKGNDTVIDVYCGRTATGVTDRKAAFHRGLNTEHTWPQSMGAKQEPMKSDMHHLFPSDTGTNSQRSNHPYGELEKVTETLPDFLGDGQHSAIGTVGGVTTFMPRPDHRGDVARAIFYFYVAYGVGATPTSGIKTDNFKREFASLWKWHHLDPVSAKEKTRNEAIYKHQRNRNPFIDHPEWVAKMWATARGGVEQAPPAVAFVIQ